MSTRRRPAICTAIAFALLSSCSHESSPMGARGAGNSISGSGALETESRPVTPFSKLSLRGMGDVVVAQTGAESLSVEADDNLLSHITTRVEGGRLVLEQDRTIKDARAIRFTVTVKDLSEVELQGTGNVRFEGVHAGNFSIRLSGTGDVNATKLIASSLTVQIVGTGNVTATGTAETTDVEIRGTGNFHGEGFETKSAFVNIAGTGDATVHASETVRANVSGPGNVVYLGSPQVAQKVTGPGSVRHR